MEESFDKDVLSSDAVVTFMHFFFQISKISLSVDNGIDVFRFKNRANNSIL